MPTPSQLQRKIARYHQKIRDVETYIDSKGEETKLERATLATLTALLDRAIQDLENVQTN